MATTYAIWTTFLKVEVTATQPVPHATLMITHFVVHLESWRNVWSKMMNTDLCSRFVPVLWVAMMTMTMVMGLIVPVMSKNFAINGFGNYGEWWNKIREMLSFFYIFPWFWYNKGNSWGVHEVPGARQSNIFQASESPLTWFHLSIPFSTQHCRNGLVIH